MFNEYAESVYVFSLLREIASKAKGLGQNVTLSYATDYPLRLRYALPHESYFDFWVIPSLSITLAKGNPMT